MLNALGPEIGSGANVNPPPLKVSWIKKFRHTSTAVSIALSMSSPDCYDIEYMPLWPTDVADHCAEMCPFFHQEPL